MLATKQDYYDLLVRSALDGTMPAYDVKKDVCYQRGPNGTKCAIGVGIPDEKFDPEMNECGIHKVYHQIRSYFPSSLSRTDLLDIQETHDESCRCCLICWDDKQQYQLMFAEEFVTRLNKLPCMLDVAQVDPRTFSAASLSNVTSPAM